MTLWSLKNEIGIKGIERIESIFPFYSQQFDILIVNRHPAAWKRNISRASFSNEL
jgi:hypothetical protein